MLKCCIRSLWVSHGSTAAKNTSRVCLWLVVVPYYVLSHRYALPTCRIRWCFKNRFISWYVQIWLIKLQAFVEFLSEDDKVSVVSPQQLFYQWPHSRCKFTTNQLVVERLSCIILSGQNPIAETPNNFNSYLGKCDNLLSVVLRDKPDQEPPY